MLQGKPLVAYSIEHGLNSKLIDKVVVSTDSKKIMDIANQYKISIIDRRKYLWLNDDKTSAVAVAKHAAIKNPDYQIIVLLQPTSPLRKINDLNCAIQNSINTDMDILISVCQIDELYYKRNGAFFIYRRKALLKNKFNKTSLFLTEDKIDIDTYDDLKQAKKVIQNEILH